MPAKPVQIGDLHFERKVDATEFFKQMLYRYDIGDRVSAKDSQILSTLLLMHPEASEKVGAGIESFSVRSGDYGTQCFWVNRIDGSSEKFSFRACYAAI